MTDPKTAPAWLGNSWASVSLYRAARHRAMPPTLVVERRHIGPSQFADFTHDDAAHIAASIKATP